MGINPQGFAWTTATINMGLIYLLEICYIPETATHGVLFV